MPPIFGILNSRLQQIDPARIRRIKEAAVYLKPRRLESGEVTGGFISAAIVSENPLAEGKANMAILGPWVIVADAALYRRKELVSRVGSYGSGSAETWGDARLILAAWLKWGKECVKKLYGDFSFVIFSSDTGEVFCGRDPLGVRPLFYTLHEGLFIFGSELRYVLAGLPEKPILRPDYLLDTLITVKTQKNLSPYENIFRLLPGHFLAHSGESIDIVPYWQANPDSTIRLSVEEEYVRLFRDKLVDSVHARCHGVSKAGTELSGGLDSSAVTGIASDLMSSEGRKCLAFSNVFPSGTDIDFKDEREFMASMRAYKPIEWVAVDRLHRAIPEILKQAIDVQGCFIQQNFSIFNQGIYERAGEQGVQVLLSGFGGDELVSARMAIPWNELIDERQWKVIWDELYYRGPTIKSILKPGILAAKYFLSKLHPQNYSSGPYTHALLNRRFKNLPLQPGFIQKHALWERYGKKYRNLRPEQSWWRQYQRIMLDHLPQRMEYCYTVAAQYGIEYRYPLLDLDLVETCLAFPPWVKQHHGINRYLFREAIKDFVPEDIRRRDDKSGTTIPQMYFSLLHEKDGLMEIVQNCSGLPLINEIFDLSQFSGWYERMVKRDMDEINYLMSGAFYDYLMILLYYRDLP